MRDLSSSLITDDSLSEKEVRVRRDNRNSGNNLRLNRLRLNWLRVRVCRDRLVILNGRDILPEISPALIKCASLIRIGRIQARLNPQDVSRNPITDSSITGEADNCGVNSLTRPSCLRVSDGLVNAGEHDWIDLTHDYLTPIPLEASNLSHDSTISQYNLSGTALPPIGSSNSSCVILTSTM